MSTFIIHTPLAQMRPVGAEGERSFARLTALVERHLSPRHAAIFADPVPVRDGGGIDWYFNGDGDVLPLSQLTADDVGRIKGDLAEMLADLRKVADALDETGTGSTHKTAVALRNAAAFPGENAIFAVRSDTGLSPLVVAWGFESHDVSAAHRFNVSAFGRAGVSGAELDAPRPVASATFGPEDAAVSPRAADASTPPRQATAAGRISRLAWLLPVIPAVFALLLIVWISALLLPACGLRTPFGTVTFGFPGTYACGAAFGGNLAVGPETGALQQELAMLQQNYQQKRLECALAAPLTAQEPVPQEMPAIPELPQQPAQAERRFEERVDQRGEAQVTLVWEGRDDLDLWLQCPDTTSIYYDRRNACGGTLDIDQNAGSQASAEPIENITFPAGLVQQGDHRVGVQLFKSKNNQFPVPFQVRVRDKNGSRVLNGQITREKEMVLVDIMKN